MTPYLQMWLNYLHQARVNKRADDERDLAGIVRVRFEAQPSLREEAEAELARIEELIPHTTEALLKNRDYIGATVRDVLRSVLSKEEEKANG